MNDLTKLTKRLAELREAAVKRHPQPWSDVYVRELQDDKEHRVVKGGDGMPVDSDEICSATQFVGDYGSDIHAAAVELDGEVERLTKLLHDEELSHGNTIDHRDKHEDRINAICAALGMDEEACAWSSHNDPSERAMEEIYSLEQQVARLTADLAAERAGAAGLREALVDLCTEVGASVVCGANHNTREVAQAYDRALHAIAATAGRDTLAELERLRAALKRIAAPQECGCRPCVGQCLADESAKIELEGIRDLAAAALDGGKGASEQ
jgi:hypothetical protein